MKILLATQKPFAAAAVNGIRHIIAGAGHEFVLLEKYTDSSELLAAVADADAMIVRSDKVTAEVVAAAPNLKIVVRAGAGYDNIDLDACTERGIVVMNTPGQNSNAVAELAIALMIYMSRNTFTPGTGCELSGKTLGVIGFGNIGYLHYECEAYILAGQLLFVALTPETILKVVVFYCAELLYKAEATVVVGHYKTVGRDHFACAAATEDADGIFYRGCFGRIDFVYRYLKTEFAHIVFEILLTHQLQEPHSFVCSQLGDGKGCHNDCKE